MLERENENQDEKNENKVVVKKEEKPRGAIKEFFMMMAAFFDRLNYSMFRNVLLASGSKYVSRVNSIELAIKVLLVVLFFMMFIIFYLVNSVIDASESKELTIVVPDQITSGTYSVEKNTASVEYFELIAQGFVSSAANYNYTNAQKKINKLLPSILPYTYSATFNTIKKNVQFIVDEKVNQKFIIQKVETLKKGSRARIVFSGLLTRTVGSIITIKNKPYEIPITLKIVDYTPYIESFDFDYVGIKKVSKDKDIAIKREEELNLDKSGKVKKKNYKERMAKKKKEF